MIMKQKYLLLTIILFVFLFLFSTPSLALIPGDFGSANNGPPDGVVDFEDLMIFAIAYGSTPSDANWNSACDIAGPGSTTPDDVIDFEDLMIFALHYGETEPSEEGILEAASAQIDLETGGVVEVTDEASEIYRTSLVIDPIDKKQLVNNRGLSEIAILLNAQVLGTNYLGDYQGWVITPVGVTAAEDVIGLIQGSLEIEYNEMKLSNSGVAKNTTPNVYRVLCVFDHNTLMPVPVPGVSWEKVPEEKITHETDKVKIDIGIGDLLYLYTLTVTNCKPPDDDDLGTPLPGDLLYRLSEVGVNDNWVPGHVGIYVGERYHEETNQKYNVIEALGSPFGFIGIGPDEVLRTHYEDITKFGGDQYVYMGAREPAVRKLTHRGRNQLIAYLEDNVGDDYAFVETLFGIWFGLAKGDEVKGDDDQYNCVGLAEAAYESVGAGIVSDDDEGNNLSFWVIFRQDYFLSPQEQLFRTVSASGIMEEDQNIAPEIDNLEISQAIEILMNGCWMYTLNCTASDQDGDSLAYIWSRNEGEGTFSPNYEYSQLTVTNGKEIIWVSPFDEGEYTISCKVIDNYGGEDVKDITINVGSSVESGYISGSVKDAVTQSLLSDVSVKVYDGSSLISSGTTDSNSAYSVTVPAGSGYRVEFTKSGYIPAIYYDVSVVADVTTYLETVLQIDDIYSGVGNISGIISNALTGDGVSGLTIDLREGINVTSGTVIATAVTESGGYYSVSDLNAGYYTAEVSGTGYNTTYFTVICIGGTITEDQDATVTPTISEGETRIVLRWGETPRDLDSHLTGPLPDDTRFHMYYWYKGSSSPWPEYVNLDLDDVTSYGPETTTIYQQIPGVYRFSIHDYTNSYSSDSIALSNSGAQVQVYRGSELIATFNVPSNQEGTLWTVFEMDGDTIMPKNTMSYESDPSVIRQSSAPDAELMKNLPSKR